MTSPPILAVNSRQVVLKKTLTSEDDDVFDEYILSSARSRIGQFQKKQGLGCGLCNRCVFKCT